ncbi:HSP20-like chaperone [Irpex rosettiformis]|uniref:HSP20-like chaperone n=1 Tax=Irpex rosettiformis TaxID=378272 RepID=A0ACB8U258_9APHY|nr:HSP20-like chaperone [Irpex rosettiformis]
MSLSRVFYEPFYSLSDFDRLFDESFNTRTGNTRLRNQIGGHNESNGSRRLALRPRLDVHENSASNTVTATFELPGLKKEDVNIDVHNNVLTISGESKVSSEHDENGYVVRERRFGRFERSLPLPQGIKSEDIKAGLENGVLTVSFPKTTPEQAPKKIAIS